MGLKVITIQYFQVENKMADHQDMFTSIHWLIPIIGLRTASQLQILFLKTTFCMDNIYLAHTQLVMIYIITKGTKLYQNFIDTKIHFHGRIWDYWNNELVVDEFLCHKVILLIKLNSHTMFCKVLVSQFSILGLSPNVNL